MDEKNTFWFENPSILLQQDQLTFFFPNSNYSVVDNLNASVRLFIYIGLALLLYTMQLKYMFLPLGAMVVTYLLYVFYPDRKELFHTKPYDKYNLTFNEKLNNKLNKKYIKPTKDNPFMNYNHITDNYHNPPASQAYLNDDPESVETREDVNNKFNEKLYRDVDDLYSRRNSQREFYTVAYNGFPDQTSFAKWLYSTGAVCKEKSANCTGFL